MAKQKTNAEPKELQAYTARGEDLKILGYVEAANEKEGLKKARKKYDAASVELRDEVPAGGEESPAEEPTSKKKASKAAAKKADKPEPTPRAAAETKTTPEAEGEDKPNRRRTPRGEPKEKKLSAIDAAVKVLEEAGQPMTCQELIGAMAAKNYWTSPGGLTPAATLYSAVLREISKKGAESRFQKTERGKFGRAK